MADEAATLSYCERAKVGCIAVKDGNILGFGYNGTLSGHENCCEILVDNELKTRDDVLHAEQNLICKAARDGISLKDATLYCTLMPCATCANLIVQSGIKRIIVRRKYRNDKGFETLTSALNKRPVEVICLEDIE